MSALDEERLGAPAISSSTCPLDAAHRPSPRGPQVARRGAVHQEPASANAIGWVALWLVTAIGIGFVLGGSSTPEGDLVSTRRHPTAQPLQADEGENVFVPYLGADGVQSTVVSRRRRRASDDEDTYDAPDEPPPGWARSGRGGR